MTINQASAGQLCVNHTQLHYRLWHGHATSTPIVCLHGWLDNAASFDRLLPLLSQHPCYAFDLPGHGLSEHYPRQNHYHFIDGITLTLALLEALALPKVILVGHSLGGCIASMVATGLSDCIESLLLLDALGPITSDPQSAHQNLVIHCQTAAQLNSKPWRIYGSIDEACQHRASSGLISAEDVRPIIERGMRHNGLGYIWRHDRQLMLPPLLSMTETQVASFLSKICVPVCHIKATQGFVDIKEKFAYRASLVPSLTSHTLDCGHHLHIEQAQQCADIFRQFLKSES